MASKKVSGANIPEGHRNTEALKLRLPKDVRALLEEKASDQEMNMSEYITALFRTMEKNPDVACGVLLEDLRLRFSDE